MVPRLPRSHSPRSPRYRAALLIALVLAGLAPAAPTTAAPHTTYDPALTLPTIDAPGPVVEREPIRLGSSAGGGSGPAGAQVGVSADASISLRPIDASADVDVKDLWTETSQTERQRDGSYTVTTAAGRMNYQDPAGEWQEIDLSLVPDATDRYGLRTTANDRHVRFGVDDASAALAAITTSKGTLGLRALDYPSRRVDTPADPEPSQPTDAPSPTPPSAAEPTQAPEPTSGPDPTPAPNPEPSPPAVEAPAAEASADPSAEATALPTATPVPDPSEAPDVEPTSTPTQAPVPTAAPAATETPIEPVSTVPTDGVVRFEKDPSAGQVTVQATDWGFRFGVVLADPSQADTYAFALSVGDLVPSLALDGRSIELAQTVLDERTELVTTELVGTIGAPTMLDANEVPARPETVAVSLYRPGSTDAVPAGVSPEALASLAPDEVVLVYAIDRAWLDDPARAYPVTLDPDACLGEGASGCTINGTGTNFDHFVGSGLGSSYPTGWTVFRVGYDSRSDDGDTYNTMRGLVYFQDVALPDGAMATIAGTGGPRPAAPPSPNGRKGGEAHQEKVEDVVESIKARGLVPDTEIHVPTPGGRKQRRFADVGAYDGDQLVELHQIGRQTKHGIPVSRERTAYDDLDLGAPGVPKYWHPYN